MPFPPIDGGAQVMHFTTKGLLANNMSLKILAINPTRSLVNLASLPSTYTKSTKIECVTVDTSIKLLKILTNIFRSESYFTERFESIAFETKLNAILKNEEFDIIQLEHLYVCKYIKTIRENSKAKIILRPQNVEYIIWERYTKNLRNIFKKGFLELATKRLKKYEQKICSELDGIIALTAEDAQLFKSFTKTTPINIVPMGYDYENLNKYDFNKQFNNKPLVYHLGAMDWMPNIEAIDWFIKMVIPQLEKQKFSGRIIIAGRKMPQWVFDCKSNILEIMDEINDPVQFQEDKRIMIVPLLSGSGIRAKIIEGLALGKTIIATSIGAQGIEYTNGKNLLIADSPEEFANQIIKCVTTKELCISISKEATLLSKNKYHFKNTAMQMIHFYQNIIAQE